MAMLERLERIRFQREESAGREQLEIVDFGDQATVLCEVERLDVRAASFAGFDANDPMPVATKAR